MEFPAEINIHYPGFKNLSTPTVLVFPKLLVCFDCGLTQFALLEGERHLLVKNIQSAADKPLAL
jgi:hypothetical protein